MVTFNVCLVVSITIFHFLARLSGDIVECLWFVSTFLMVLFVRVIVIEDIALCKYVASDSVLEMLVSRISVTHVGLL